MPEEVCPTCRGRGTIPTVDEPCEATIKVGHETFTCWANRKHPDIAHMALLENPCGSCGGYDAHSKTCPDIGTTTDGARWYYWFDSSVRIFEATKEQGRVWQARFYDPVT